MVKTAGANLVQVGIIELIWVHFAGIAWYNHRLIAKCPDEVPEQHDGGALDVHFERLMRVLGGELGLDGADMDRPPW